MFIKFPNQGIKQSCINLFPCALFGFLGFFGSSMLAVDWFNAVPGDLGDARFNSVILEHIYGWLQGRWTNLWSPIFFYPYAHVLAFSDNHFGSVAPYILFRGIGLSREQGFIAWYLFGIVLNYFSCFYVFRRIGLASFSAAAGAFVFTFSLPTVLSQEMHAQMVYRYAIPMAFLALCNMYREKKISALPAVCFWTAVQFYCSIYLGLFLIYFLLAFMVGLLISERHLLSQWFAKRGMERQLVLKYQTILLTLICAASVGYLLIRYKVIASEYQLIRSKETLRLMLPTLKSYLIGDVSIWTAFTGRWIDDVPMRYEHQLFFGIGPSLIFFLGLFSILKIKNNYLSQGDPLLRVYGKAAIYALLILFVMTLRVGNLSVYHLVTAIPGLESIQAVTRVILIMALPFGLIVAIACQSIMSYLNTRLDSYKMMLGGLLLILLLGYEALFSIHTHRAISTWTARINPLLDSMKGVDISNKIIFVSATSAEPYYLTELDGMIVSQILGIPTINGYSGNFPPGYIDPKDCEAYKIRLAGYERYRQALSLEAQEMEGQVVVLPVSSCAKP